jgi:hypothetical protein
MGTAQLMYTIICDDVRLEMGNKLSLMGIFENVFFPSFPSILLRLAVVNHWVGVGDFETRIRILSPDGKEVASSAPSTFRIEAQGYADNVTVFTNVAFDRAGTFNVQILLDGRSVSQKSIYVHLVQQPPATIN